MGGARQDPMPVLADTGLDIRVVEVRDLVYEGHGNSLYRVRYQGASYVLKLLAPENSREVSCYELLSKYSVPTLQVHSKGPRAILLNDLAVNDEWMLASEEDLSSSDTGMAIAGWYRALHSAGRQLVESGEAWPEYLDREINLLSPERLENTGRKLGLTSTPTWRLVQSRSGEIATAMEKLNQTLTYNDFHWTNLALTRSAQPQEAIVFDYHLLGVGIRYADYRNVIGSLRDGAAEAFAECFGALDQKEEILDKATSPVAALVVAAGRERFPKWAEPCLEVAKSGGLERCFRDALEIIPHIK